MSKSEGAANEERGAGKPIILTFLAYYLPGYKSGGPARSIENMVEHLSEDLQFWIVTADRDVHEPEPYLGIKVDQWNRVANANVFYASPAARGFTHVTKLIRETPHDLLYLNSFFNPVFTSSL